MEIASKYDPRAVEEKWYEFWLEKKLFHSEPDHRKAYTVVIPPPNVTGVLHMGHMLNNTIQDVLVRRARMMGKNACWVPGTDHASISTEAKVVKMLAERGIDKRSLTRDEFLKYAWEWKEKYGGIILKQLRKLGASCDWDRTAFTMDEVRYESVIRVFVDLYNKGLIYRGARMVNWDPQALTAVSDEEVIYKESHGKLFYLKYFVDGEDRYIVVATTRPETIMGDTAVCVHPEDERYQWLKGKRVVVPGVGRVVPIIMDEYVDREFGTGALKITPAHDINDYNLGLKHSLDSINIFNDNGTLNANGGKYAGMDRFACRKAIMKDLEEAGLVEKTEDYVNKVGHSERTDAVIEPKLSTQWFVKMSEIAKKALEVVENGKIQFHPEKFKNSYRHWLENIKDWCISRQLWWGHRIPAYYFERKTKNGDSRTEIVVALNEEEARKIAAEKYGYRGELRQDEDVLDTWFSSWLWPISLFDGIRNPDNEEIKYYYPTDDLITAPDIIFFWVARMIMAGEEYRDEVPFKNVYFTGIVRDKLGRKMSKSLGNSPDPIELIEKYGADGVRMGMLLTAPAGNDLPFDESICEQGRNFANKIWNALRLVKGWAVSDELQQSAENAVSVEWMEQRMACVLEEIEKDFDQYRLSEALMSTYKLVWDDFCSWFLEMVKPAYGTPIDRETYDATIRIFERLMCMLHPFMPFITEEIWHLLQDTSSKVKEDLVAQSSIMMQHMPVSVFFDQRMLDDCERAQEVIAGVRNIRNSKGLSPKETLDLFVTTGDGTGLNSRFDGIIKKLANVGTIEYVSEKVEGAVSFMVGTTECFVPLKIKDIDVEAERKKLEEELKYAEGFLASVMKKLGNEKFVNGAPEKVVAVERQKKADAEKKIAAIKAQIEQLGK
ncbi:MAG: valine--tRNA ligase [Bacteroidales bacterium]|nr:valine--tRNA ligase [Bacteroidales bacterium]MBR6330841.1 valine--tRNA ligase [Bacteroidales bacterium]